MFGICSSKYVAASSHIFIPFYTGWLIGIPLMDYDNPKYIGWSLQSSIYQQGCLAATALILVYSYVPHHTISWLNIPISHSAIILLSHYITVYYPMKYPLQSSISHVFFFNTDCYGFPLVEGPCHPTCRAHGRWPATRRVRKMVERGCIIHMYIWYMYVFGHIIIYIIYIYTLYIHITIISYYHVFSVTIV